MEILDLTLTKTNNYNLIPFGSFTFEIKLNKRAKRINAIYLVNLNIDHLTTMPLTEEQSKELVKNMIKNKTEVYCNYRYGYRFYTITTNGFSEIHHWKLTAYTQYLIENNLEDSIDSWNKYIDQNSIEKI